MGQHDKTLIHYSEGRGNLGKVENKVESWGKFVAMLSNPTKTRERRKQYDKMSVEEQRKLKNVDGYIMGAPVSEGRRANKNIMPRDVGTLDYDYATEGFVFRIMQGVTPLSKYEFFIHSTRRHTEEKPRLRMFFPMSRPVTADEWGPLSRIVAMIMEGGTTGMTMVDPVSFRPAQMMFKPTISSDGEFLSYRNEGELLDPDAIFEWYAENVGDWTDYASLPRCEGEDELRKSADKAEDPTTKKGPVGDFCRAYDVPAAIDKFLSDKYEPVAGYSGKPRYTYLGGTSASGAEVQDDGLFLYSHHGTDPVADRLVNAFDLVRVHLYGDLDEDAEKDTPPTKLPSYKRMVEMLADDEEYRRSQAETRYDISAMFDDVVEDEDDDPEPDPPIQAKKAKPPADIADLLGFDDDDEDDPVRRLLGSGPASAAEIPPRKKTPKPKPPKGWFPDDLELDQNGRIVSSLSNASVIIHNDARMFYGIRFNEFSNQIVCTKDIKSKLPIVPAFYCRDKVNGDPWQDFNDVTIRAILEAPNGEGKAGYGMRMTDRDLAGAIVLTARTNKFHPIRDYLCDQVWDGRPRVDRLLVRYLGCPDTPYHRQIIRLKLVAAVARIFEPGHKFDFAIIMSGPQGIRKSTFVKTLFGEEHFGEIDCKLDDRQKIAEALAGIWGGELPELSAFHKSDHNAAKMFLRRVDDDIRMAYDRRTSVFPRQCVFFGTTNDTKYLKDPTGNRSYWPCLVTVDTIDTDSLAAERDQIWAEAVTIYREMRAEQPVGTLPLYLAGEAEIEAKRYQEDARTQELHELWAEKIMDWLDEPVTLTQLRSEFGADAATMKFDDNKIDPSSILVQRCAFSTEQAQQFALGKPAVAGDYQTVQNIGRALPLITGWSIADNANSAGAGRRRILGKQGRYRFRDDATAEERFIGYRVIETERNLI